MHILDKKMKKRTDRLETTLEVINQEIVKGWYVVMFTGTDIAT